MNKTPSNVKSILKKLRKSDDDIAEFCINRATEAVKAGGYHDAKLWATNILSAIIGELKYVEDENDIHDLMVELDGIERDVIESIYESFTDMADNLADSDPADIKDTIVYSLSKKLDSMDRNKYLKAYG